MKKSNLVKMIVVATSLVIMTGCTSNAEREQTKSDIVKAQQTADAALSKANAAMDAANAAQAAADESSERARRMMEKNMAK